MDTIPPQPTVMVTGSGGCQLRSVAVELFDERARAADGAVVVTTRESPTTTVRRLTGGPAGFDPDKLAVVDARGSDDDPGVDDPGADDDLDVGQSRHVDPGDDPAAMDEAVTAGLAWLVEADVDRRHFLYDTLATDNRPAGEGTAYDRPPGGETAYDRAYRIAMTVGAEEGLALFTLDVEGLSADVVERLGHLFDVHVELRERRGGTELRWSGLLGASEEWVGLAEADLGVGGFR